MRKCKNDFVIKLIKKYQKNKQLIGVGHCKFYPTCSNYALETYKKFNFFYASILVGIRILRCNPLAKRKYYPVKLTKEEKARRKYLDNIKAYLNDDFIDYLDVLTKEPITGEMLYSAIYDYYYLPKFAHTLSDFKDETIYTNRFIVTNKEFQINKKNQNLRSFEEYLKITNELYEQKIINVLPIKSTLIESDKVLIPLDSITTVEILKNLNIHEGIIILNNYNQTIKYLDFTVVHFTTNKIKDFKQLIDNKTKLIVLTNNLNILEYLEYITYSINYYTNALDINYFFNLNKRKEACEFS